MLTQNQVCLVTGGAGGIGWAITEEILNQGGIAAVADRNPALLARAVEQCKARGIELERLLPIEIDLTESAAPAQVLEKALAWSGGRMHTLINCAGITRDGVSWKMEDEQYDLVQSINARAAFRLSREFVKLLRSRKESAPPEERALWSIVNISSIIGVIGAFGQTNYAAAKHALIGITKCMAIELAKVPIRVNAVAPGYTETDLTAQIPEKILEQIVESIPMGRRAKPEEIARVVVAVAGPAFSYMTGETVVVDGGVSIR